MSLQFDLVLLVSSSRKSPMCSRWVKKLQCLACQASEPPILWCTLFLLFCLFICLLFFVNRHPFRLLWRIPLYFLSGETHCGNYLLMYFWLFLCFIGKPIEDDLIIITGVRKGSGCSEPEVQSALIKVLCDELGLNVSAQPGITLVTNDWSSSTNANQAHENKSNFQSNFDSLTRKPPDLGRLLVTRKSLHCWLQKRVGIGRQEK